MPCLYPKTLTSMKALESSHRPFILILLTAAHVAGGSRGHSSHSYSQRETHKGGRIQRQLLHVSSSCSTLGGLHRNQGEGSLQFSDSLDRGRVSISSMSKP